MSRTQKLKGLSAASLRLKTLNDNPYLFCYHQFYAESKRRKLTIKEREFEAKTVAWLVCKRHGIYNPSEEYLA